MIWKKVLIKETLKIMLFFLASFTFLYVLIDYSIHAKSFMRAHLGFLDISIYYLCHLTKRAAILIPFSLLLASLKVLLSLNNSRELLALYSAGLSPRKILSCLLLLALFSSGFLYFNEEILLPFAQYKLEEIEESHIAFRPQDSREHYLYSLALRDGSTLIYQHYDPKRQAFFDLFWIEEQGKRISRIKTLVASDPPTAEYCDIMQKQPDGNLSCIESYEHVALPRLSFDAIALGEAHFLPNSASLSTLFAKVGDKRTDIAPQLTFRLLMPLLTFAVVLLPSGISLSFSRKKPLFLIYSGAIFGFIFLITMLDAALIMSESGSLPAGWTSLFLLAPLYAWSVRVWIRSV